MTRMSRSSEPGEVHPRPQRGACAREAERASGGISLAVRRQIVLCGGAKSTTRGPSLRGLLAVADRRDLDFTYSLTDRIFRLSMGELADFSGAKYDGDFSLSLEDAQRRKHEYVAEQIGIGPGRRTLDLGCGWGGLQQDRA